jgi:hypothetical protein
MYILYCGSVFQVMHAFNTRNLIQTYKRGRLRKNNQVIVSRKKKNKIQSGQGSHRVARYPDELAD